jgi:hypothetical protein
VRLFLQAAETGFFVKQLGWQKIKNKPEGDLVSFYLKTFTTTTYAHT